MRLASLRAGGRDGTLIVVRRDARAYAVAADAGLPRTLQQALDDWDRAAPRLARLSEQLDAGAVSALPLDVRALAAPLPRAYEWLDGSAFLPHVERARGARHAAMPPDFERDPLMYQGGSGALLGPCDDVPLRDEAWGLDLEAEVAVILGDVALGTSADDALASVRLVCLANDWSLRGLVAAELAKGFGFVISKPATAFSPFAVTPDELGDAWRDGRLHLPVRAWRNDEPLGACDAGEMHFSFGELVAHVARTRELVAGTIVGSGTVSNRDERRGVTCLVERRALETIACGRAATTYLRAGERVRIDAGDASPFGVIEQKVVVR
jgi:fumarylacetoacetate (FAA) hydrolase